MSLSTYSSAAISNTSLVYRSKINRSTQIIYLVTVLTILLTIAALPFIKIPISVKSNGLLQSSIEKTELTVPVNGRLIKMQLTDNKKVKQGETLLIIDATLAKQQGSIVQNRQGQTAAFLQDIRILMVYINRHGFSYPPLQTGQYTASWQQFAQELENARIAKNQAENTYDRYNKLYQNKAITESEYERYKFEFAQSQSAYKMIINRYKTQWQTEANNLRTELQQLSGQQVELNEQKKQYTLKAPIDGSIQNLTGLQVGAYVFASQKIGEISPNAAITAFCYVKPADIGLIKKGQDVRFQVDAFNYNQWGLATGKVLDISDDIIVIDNQPVFKVRCDFTKGYLELKNGYKGYLKKGMSFTARFTVAERSLYQLLYDKVDDWVNPNVSGKI
ncbi:HlyD family efflux transporter periplasmic adaptor subunit [Pedobacter hiemivivus]|uniref:HlyD family efflux transporter periplasmic adaptor subunit n=1 Tax=Pedobacter hiemivivus TaxID=2530454 RepID=A0A4V2MKM3_9SPHI|nr:HlyD family efflux transporter periplasmic adaptor subunit [Pedobacter hiemivivus]TCC98606.1 HlyD family efflux transporter periplasmic adaptor subunit [Pedobacter hiemivivus]TKC65255.1 HlyD family efflux transporter periplasmic adaptor subunit [Pedobacter hiemivivus]